MENLIENIHEIKIYGRTLSFYRERGVDCKYGDVINVKSSELPPNSRIIVECICGECFNKFKIPFGQYLRMKEKPVCSPKCRIVKTKRHLIEEYGVDNVSKLESVKLLKKKSSQNNYGVDNVSQSNIIKKKKVATTLKHFGVDNVSKSKEIKEKKIKTCQNNYGVDYPSQSQKIMDRYVKTIQKKYGIEFTNISQIPEIMDKKIRSGIKTKKYTLPSGRIVKVQGYESHGIEFLLKRGISENDIIVGNREIEEKIGVIWFYDEKKNKNRRYFPDIFVISLNTIYEVKSTYTMNLNVKLIKLKKESILEKGMKYEFLVFNNNGDKIEQ